MVPTDATAHDLHARLSEIATSEHDDASRAALSGRHLGLYALVTLGITLAGFLVLAL
ncbi:hypothetical protein [Arthrobacter sp. Ld5]|uniref:hypothetical protein n=1 Tax=Arthrobacter sp. Ld5 TaxID=649152 RepID=UPI003EB9E849